MVSVNAPGKLPRNLDYTISLESPIGTTIRVTLFHQNKDGNRCENDYVEITDPTKLKTSSRCSDSDLNTFMSYMHVLDIRAVTGKSLGVAMDNYTIKYEVVQGIVSIQIILILLKSD